MLCPLSALSRLVRSVLVPLLTPQTWRTKDPAPQGAQEMGALWSGPASEALPQVNVPLGPWGICLGQGLTMA